MVTIVFSGINYFSDNEIVKKPVLLIGNSIGGVIALNTSKKLSQKALGVILIDCAQRTMDDKRLAEQTLLMRFLRPVIKTFVRQRLLRPPIVNTPPLPTIHTLIFNILTLTPQKINKRTIKKLEDTNGSGNFHKNGYLNINKFQIYLYYNF